MPRWSTTLRLPFIRRVGRLQVAQSRESQRFPPLVLLIKLQLNRTRLQQSTSAAYSDPRAQRRCTS
jgi:hypothetical protein